MNTNRDSRFEAKDRATLSSARRATAWDGQTIFGKERRPDEDIAPCRILGSTRSQTRVMLALLLLLSTVCIYAQNFSIDWHTIDGGGGTSSGGVYSISSTVGQPDAGAMGGGAYSLAGGFWGIISAIQTPGAPLLTIRPTQTNTVVVSWPSPSTGFLLQQKSDLNSSAWNAPPENITDNGTNRFIIVNPPNGARFFRLFNP